MSLAGQEPIAEILDGQVVTSLSWVPAGTEIVLLLQEEVQGRLGGADYGPK